MPDKIDVHIKNLETLVLSLKNSLSEAQTEINRLKTYITILDRTYVIIEQTENGDVRIRY